jgi:hypothetical protein
MDEATVSELEYLRLRCDILEQVDRDMFGRGLAAGAACGRAAEAFSGDKHVVWAKCILLGVLGRRDREALPRWKEEREEVKKWMEGEEFAGLPRGVKERIGRDSRGA